MRDAPVRSITGGKTVDTGVLFPDRSEFPLNLRLKIINRVVRIAAGHQERDAYCDLRERIGRSSNNPVQTAGRLYILGFLWSGKESYFSRGTIRGS